MKILAIAHGSGYGGAQVSTLELLGLIKDVAELRIVVSSGTD